MKQFKIRSTLSWFVDPKSKNNKQGFFIYQEVDGYFHDDYHGGNENLRNTIGTVENIINTLKNQFLNKSFDVLRSTSNTLIHILVNDFPKILAQTGKQNLTVCVVPRSKAEKTYSQNQLVFKRSVQAAALKLQFNGFTDGTSYIIRHTDTRTTHLDKSGWGGDGDLPYPGITSNTCIISSQIKGRDILLVDDLYTESVNIDEDAIQALFNYGANSVVFYSLGKTLSKI